MEMSSTNTKDHHHKISKSTTTTIKDKSTARPNKNHSLNYIYNNKSQTTSYDQDQEEDFMMINNAFSWPPRSYTCSFCKREFRSAQALGGHMNVHRKDRARLRQSPPTTTDNIVHGRYGTTTSSSSTTTFLNLNLNHSPNPNNPNNPNNSLSSLLSSPPYSGHSSSDHNVNIASKKWPTHHHELNRVRYPSMIMRDVKGGSDYSAIVKSNKSTLCGLREDQLHEGFSGNNKDNVIETTTPTTMTTTTTTTVRLDLEIGLLRGHDSEIIGRDLDLELRLGYSN